MNRSPSKVGTGEGMPRSQESCEIPEEIEGDCTRSEATGISGVPKQRPPGRSALAVLQARRGSLLRRASAAMLESLSSVALVALSTLWSAGTIAECRSGVSHQRIVEDRVEALHRACDERRVVEECSDEVFVRRTYLDIVGRIPTVDECNEFLSNVEPNKRGELIDSLLESPGHVSRMFSFFADLLRVKNRLSPQVPGAPYIHFLKSSIADNKPYDELVVELLTAEGPARARGHGATGFALRDRDMPEDNIANTLNAFLGTRMECAQCHDHPEEPWTRRQFYESMAFVGGVRDLRTIRELPNFPLLKQVASELYADEEFELYRAMQDLIHPALLGVFGSGTGLVRLPRDYQYEDGIPEDWIVAKSPFGREISVPAQHPNPNGERRTTPPETPAVHSRAAFASWLASSENERFVRTIVERLWEHSMGYALDSDQRLHALEELMVEVGFDLRAYQRVFYRSRFWNTRSETDQAAASASGAPLVRRMSAEQVWDSVLTMIRGDLDEDIDCTGADRAERVYRRYEHFCSLTEDELREEIADVADRMRDSGTKRRIRNASQGASEQPSCATKRPTAQPMTEKLVRASELNSPAKEGHFLRRFGQSDREQMQGSHRDASVPQALAMSNGFVERELLENPDAALRVSINAAESFEEAIEIAFLGILSRRPSEAELATWSDAPGSDPHEDLEDLLWVLLNSHEFVFLQ